MTHRRDEQWLDHWFADGPTEVADRVIEGALTTIESTPQRHVRVPWRTSNMNALFRVVAVAAAALAIIFGPLNLLPHGTGPGVNGNASPSPAPLPPTACPAGTVLKSGDIATIAGAGVAGVVGRWRSSNVGATRSGYGARRWRSIAGGVIYFSDTDNHVRPADRDRRPITTIAGRALLAIRAMLAATIVQLTAPMGLAFDLAGNLYHR